MWRGTGREGIRGINADGRRKETGLGLVNTQYNTQLMYYRTVHLKPT